MYVKIKLEEDAEFREAIRLAIEAQVKSVTREHIIDIIESVAQKKLDGIIKDMVEKIIKSNLSTVNISGYMENMARSMVNSSCLPTRIEMILRPTILDSKVK